LANAEGAVAESIRARKLLIVGLEKLLDTNKAALADEENQLSVITERRAEIDEKKRDVEDSIMRGFSTNSPVTPVGDASPGNPGQQSPVTPGPEPDRPEVEALTPPGYPAPQNQEPVPVLDINHANGGNNTVTTAGSDLLSSLSSGYGHLVGQGSAKKRKLNTDDFPDLGGDDGLDADVAEMLRQG
jgi:regulator of Ty1 transposition protein 103